jgi:hypothetical protein
MANVAYAGWADSRVRQLSHVVPASLPLSRGLRLSPECTGGVTLQGLLEGHLAASAPSAGGASSASHLIRAHGAALSGALDAMDTVAVLASPDAADAACRAAQLAALRATGAHVAPTALGAALGARMASAQAFVALRRRLTSQLGVHAMATLLIAAGGDRLPGRIALNTGSGSVQAVDWRLSYGTPNGYAHAGHHSAQALEPVPFRLTRGLAGALGHAALLGGMAPAMVAADRALLAAHDTLWPLVALLYRDDAAETRGLATPAAFAQQQALPPSGSGVLEEQHAYRRAVGNTTALFARVVDHQSPALSSRMLRAAPPCAGEPDKLLRFPVMNQLDRALSEDALARTTPGFHAWW